MAARFQSSDGCSGDGTAAAGATLVIACDPAFALEISYRTQDIVDRINRYFGYRAIAQLRIVQVPGTAEVAAGATTRQSRRTASRPSLDRVSWTWRQRSMNSGTVSQVPPRRLEPAG